MDKQKYQPAIAIQGGCSVVPKAQMTKELYDTYILNLKCSVDAGKEILDQGGSSLDAVEAAITKLEDCPLFNAGKGAAFTSQESHELDASIMDGYSRKAGSVCNVTNVKNPIKLARIVMDRTTHVIFAGKGAEEIAAIHKLELVDQSYFYTDARMSQLKQVQQFSSQSGIDKAYLMSEINQIGQQEVVNILNRAKMGTVGAVALDKQGNLAAGTSTGGLTNKKLGRVGDSGIIGAGNYADNQTCAVTCTGSGEFFLRSLTAYDCAALIVQLVMNLNIQKYKNYSLEKASESAMQECINLGGSGGLLALNRSGEIVCPFSTDGLYRGWWRQNQEVKIAIYKDE